MACIAFHGRDDSQAGERQPSASRDSPPLALVAAYLGVGAAGVCSLAVLLPSLYPRALWSYAHHIPTLLIVHWFALGWALPVANGVLIQMAPTTFGTPHPSVRPFTVALAWHGAGTAALIAGFWWLTFELVAVGGGMILIGQMRFGHTLWRAVARAPHGEVQRSFLHASLLYLAATIAVGITLALLLAVVPSWPLLRALPLHAAFGAIGWFTTLIIGISYQLLPMFSLSHGAALHPDRVKRLIHAGVAVTGAAGLLALPRGWWWIPLSLWALAWLAYAADLRAIARAQRGRRADPAVRAAYWNTGYPLYTVLLAAGGLLFSGLTHPGWTIAGGVLLLFGWIGGMIAAFLPKITAFLVWHHRFTHRVGSEAVPTVSALMHPRLLAIGWAFYHAGVTGMALAALIRSERLGQGAAWCFGLGIIGLLSHIVRTVRISPSAATTPAAHDLG